MTVLSAVDCLPNEILNPLINGGIDSIVSPTTPTATPSSVNVPTLVNTLNIDNNKLESTLDPSPSHHITTASSLVNISSNNNKDKKIKIVVNKEEVIKLHSSSEGPSPLKESITTFTDRALKSDLYVSNDKSDDVSQAVSATAVSLLDSSSSLKSQNQYISDSKINVVVNTPEEVHSQATSPSKLKVGTSKNELLIKKNEATKSESPLPHDSSSQPPSPVSSTTTEYGNNNDKEEMLNKEFYSYTGFICQKYNPQCYYYEIVELIRNNTTALIKVFLQPTTLMASKNDYYIYQVLSLVIVNNFFASLHLFVQPFRSRQLNIKEAIFNVVLLIECSVGVLLNYTRGNIYSGVVGYIVFYGALIFGVVYTLYLAYQKEDKRNIHIQSSQSIQNFLDVVIYIYMGTTGAAGSLIYLLQIDRIPKSA